MFYVLSYFISMYVRTTRKIKELFVYLIRSSYKKEVLPIKKDKICLPNHQLAEKRLVSRYSVVRMRQLSIQWPLVLYKVLEGRGTIIFTV